METTIIQQSSSVLTDYLCYLQNITSMTARFNYRGVSKDTFFLSWSLVHQENIWISGSFPEIKHIIGLNLKRELSITK